LAVRNGTWPSVGSATTWNSHAKTLRRRKLSCQGA
jgi:hypothetical protein